MVYISAVFCYYNAEVWYMDYCKYVDVFYGNGETDRIFEDGLASKWFYIKALCGNTAPHAVLPFGKMSVGPFSGGYPTGYGTHFPNSCGGIRKMEELKIKGFSHLHQSGTGGIQYYYNYAVVSPYYGEPSFRIPQEETARPGYYAVTLEDIRCECTVEGGVAIHRYRFGKESGRLEVDFTNDGLSKEFSGAFQGEAENLTVTLMGENGVGCSGIFAGIRLYFYVQAEGCFSVEGGKAILEGFGRETVLRLAFSTHSVERAKAEVERSACTVEQAAQKARDLWNKHLSVLRVKTKDEALLKRFYSNLYFSLVKPCDLEGETVLGVEDAVAGLATLWDQYKTVYPLIYLCYPEMGGKLANGLVNISRALGKIPCSFGLTNRFPCEEQAKMLGILALCDAYHLQVPEISRTMIEECTIRELEREDFKSFLEEGIFERYTHILDTTDACLSVAAITQSEALKTRLLELAEHWKKAYGADGLMSEESPYYEGNRYTYSFRLQQNMEERVALAGGKERFATMLDDFFGYGKESVKQLTYRGAAKEIEAASHHRFEGFNNECDMETPYAYLYADRHDRLCEIVAECVARCFGEGSGGLPGNNDSGGLSSLFVWNALGIFPVSGRGEFLLGAPQLNSELTLHNGKTLRIERKNSGIFVESIRFNGKHITDYRLSASELLQGGCLEFEMK